MGIYYSAVIGKITDKTYEYVIRFNLYENKMSTKLDEVFMIPEKQVPEIPEEWLAQIEEHSYRGYLPGQYNHAVSRLGDVHALTTLHGGKNSGKQSGREVGGNPTSLPGHEQGRQMASLWDNYGGNFGQHMQQFDKEPDMHFNARTGVVTSADQDENEDTVLDLLLNGNQQQLGIEGITNSESQLDFGFKKTAGGVVVAMSKEEIAQQQLKFLDTAAPVVSGDLSGVPTLKKSPDLAETSPLPGSANESRNTTNSGTTFTSDGEGAQFIVLPHSGEFEEIAAKYGVDIADSYDSLDTDLDDIAEHDELLLKVIRKACNMLGENGRTDLNTNGI